MKKAYYHEISEADGKKKCLKIDVSYSKGGINYFNGQTNRRGIYVHFTEVERSFDRGYVTESHSLFSKSSFKILVLELKRLSQKKLEAVYESIGNIKNDLFEQQKVLNKEIIFQMINNIKIA